MQSFLNSLQEQLTTFIKVTNDITEESFVMQWNIAIQWNIASSKYPKCDDYFVEYSKIIAVLVLSKIITYSKMNFAYSNIFLIKEYKKKNPKNPMG